MGEGAARRPSRVPRAQPNSAKVGAPMETMDCEPSANRERQIPSRARARRALARLCGRGRPRSQDLTLQPPSPPAKAGIRAAPNAASDAPQARNISAALTTEKPQPTPFGKRRADCAAALIAHCSLFSLKIALARFSHPPSKARTARISSASRIGFATSTAFSKSARAFSRSPMSRYARARYT